MLVVLSETIAPSSRWSATNARFSANNEARLLGGNPATPRSNTTDGLSAYLKASIIGKSVSAVTTTS